MKLALMQPYFMPYLGYYSVMAQVDKYIFFDTAQYIKGGWINRNRILKPGGADWQYITVPLRKHTSDAAINNVLIDNTKKWKEKILSQLSHYHKKGCFYKAVTGFFEDVLSNDYEKIIDLDIALDQAVCRYLGLKVSTEKMSDLKIDMGNVNAPDEWGLSVCCAFGADEYWNAPGGVTFFDASKYEGAGIKLCFVQTKLQHYRQLGESFQPGLSILDVMMFNSPESICEMLDLYEIIGD